WPCRVDAVEPPVGVSRAELAASACVRFLPYKMGAVSQKSTLNCRVNSAPFACAVRAVAPVSNILRRLFPFAQHGN
ncbi:MAG: hypothetical protein ACK53K_05755, partial [Burkholderiales bacterium]